MITVCVCLLARQHTPSPSIITIEEGRKKMKRRRTVLHVEAGVHGGEEASKGHTVHEALGVEGR
jgi:hypothetical protein